ncbi:EAL domain-containing protein [Bradyrhizobium sp. 27S5]|uniref:EAL domain-containing protein n=2 Tax=unclassified Bradyrhizobium TaxID=2631580 RepID=UPI0030CD9DE6
MVEMITKTAKIMQKQVVAEFVESLAILDELRQIGVDYAQGYAIGKPVPVFTLWEEKIAWGAEIVPNWDFLGHFGPPSADSQSLSIRKTFKKPLVARSVSIMPYSNSLI